MDIAFLPALPEDSELAINVVNVTLHAQLVLLEDLA